MRPGGQTSRGMFPLPPSAGERDTPGTPGWARRMPREAETVELESERLERRQLESLSTAELIRHAIEEARLLARAEVLHAKKELQEEVKAARTSGILLGAGGVLGLMALAALLVAAGMALPLGDTLGVLLVGVFLVLLSGGLAFAGVKRLPKKPLPHTQERLKTDVARTREALQ